MHIFPQVSSAWSIKMIKDDQLKFMRIVHNMYQEHEASESLNTNFNKHAASVTLTQSFPDSIIVDINKLNKNHLIYPQAHVPGF